MELNEQNFKSLIKESLKETLNNNDIKLTLTISDAAKLSGIGRDKITELIYKGELPHFKVGSKTLINRNKFIVWLDNVSEKRLIL